MKKKLYTRFIRIGGTLIMSPRFAKKSDADNWYHEQRRKKQYIRDGMVLHDKEGVRFIEYARTWLTRRMKEYPMATWKADEQRLRDYVLPFLSEVPISNISASQIRALLLKISETGYLKEGFKISTSTRTRVQALLSALFGDAFNENPPLVPFNPAIGIIIKEKRKGRKKPETFRNREEAVKFLTKANETGATEYALCSAFVMTGCRKQELIVLRWENVSFAKKTIRISEKFEQASRTIQKGTKGGEDSTREVPISDVLVQILKDHKSKTTFREDSDFVFCDSKGQHLKPRYVYQLILDIAKEAGLKSSPHKLRHFYGLEFAMNDGNVKALQAILGHTSSATTDIYSDLAGDRLKGFGEVVKIDIGVKRSGD